MHKRKIHHVFTKIKPVSYWYFVILFVLSSFVAVVSLRANNVRALELRDKVLLVDKQDGDVELALRELREFTYSHMNSRLSSDTGIYPPIQLKYRYERLVEAEKKRVSTASQDVYGDAQKYCEKAFPVGLSGSNRLPCIKQYVQTHSTQKATEQSIPDDMYKFDFVSPVWSPDLAGWSLVVAGLALGLLVTRLAAEAWFRHQLDN